MSILENTEGLIIYNAFGPHETHRLSTFYTHSTETLIGRCGVRVNTTENPYYEHYDISIYNDGVIAIFCVCNMSRDGVVTPSCSPYNRYIVTKGTFCQEDTQNIDALIMNGSKNCSYNEEELRHLVKDIEIYVKEKMERVKEQEMKKKQKIQREEERVQIERVMKEQERVRREEIRREREEIQRADIQERQKEIRREERIREQIEEELCNKRAKEGAIKHKEAKEKLKMYVGLEIKSIGEILLDQ